MKNWYLLFLILFFMSSSAEATNMLPKNLQKGDPTFTVYDCSSDVALRNKLEDDYHKKYVKKINDNYYVDIGPMRAYEQEVVIPFAKNKKQLKDCPIIYKEVLNSK